jgi:adenylate cyclase class 2
MSGLKSMKYEVEQKHLVSDRSALLKRLAVSGATLGTAVVQSDQYFAHPARDYVATDEALRIRSTGDGSLVTYKGPKLDVVTKTRRELELPLHPHDPNGSQFAELLLALGFRPVATVRKHRQKFHIERAGRQVDGALDDVDGVGSFIELELIADEAELEETKQVIRDLAAELGLGPTERRSYLGMLLEQHRQQPAN